MAEKEPERAVYDVSCSDGTEGRISPASPAEAGEMAEEMCRVHNGVKKQPEPRS